MTETQILTSDQDIEAIGPEWRELYTRIDAGPFAGYNLFKNWWYNIGKDDGNRKPYVIIARENGKLVGVLPVTILRRAGLRIMQAAGFHAYNCDIPAESVEVATVLWNAARALPDYDFAAIRDVYPQSVSYKALESIGRKRDILEAFIMRLTHKSGQEWWDSLSADHRHKYKRTLRRLVETAPFKYEVCTEGTVPSAVIESMVDIKVKWALKNKKPGLFYRPKVHQYFKEMLQDAADDKRLFLAWGMCGDGIIAYNQAFIHQKTIHMPFWTYNPEFARISPVNIVLVNTIQWAIDNGMEALDLRLGDGQLKRRYCNVDNHSAEFTFSRTLKGRIIEATFYTVRSLVRFARKVADRIRRRGEGA